MAIPKFEHFYLPTLKFFKDNKIHTKKEIAELNANYFDLSEEDLKEKTQKGANLKYKDRTGWAVNHLSAAGLLTREKRGKYKITEEGHKVLEKNIDYIDLKFLAQYESYREYNTSLRTKINKYSSTPNDLEIETTETILSPTDRLEEVYTEINNELSEELYDMLINNTPEFFEKLVVDLLLKMGYGLNEDSGEVTPFTKDGGIDGIIFEDELGLSQIHIQAKRHTNPIGESDMKTFAYTLEHGMQKGVMITTSTFTKGAKKISKESNANIVLIDGKKLTQLMIKHNVGVNTQSVYAIKKIDKDYFEED